MIKLPRFLCNPGCRGKQHSRLGGCCINEPNKKSNNGIIRSKWKKIIKKILESGYN